MHAKPSTVKKSGRHFLGLAFVIILPLLLTACGGSGGGDSSTSSVSGAGAVTVSGVVVDAVKRTLISGASVTIRVNGSSYTALSAPDSHASPGSFSFSRVPAESEYFITINATEKNYAPYFYANSTPRISNNSGGIGTQDIGSSELYQAVISTINVKNILGNTAITGLTLYYDTKDIAEQNSSATVSISGVDIIASESTSTVDGVTAGTGIYSFLLPNNGIAYAIKVQQLMDTGEVNYAPYNATITDNVLTNLLAGKNESFYLKVSDPQPFTIFLHLVDDKGHAFDAGNVLVLNAAGATEALYAERKLDTTNVYVLTTDAATFDFTVLNIDLDNDGVNDTAAIQLTTLDETTNVLDGDSFDDNREATVVVPMTLITNVQNIAAEMLSNDASQFQVNGTAEVIFAFDRPVEIVHDIRFSSLTLNALTVTKSIELTASLFESASITTAATLTGNNAGTVARNGVTLNTYDYIQDDNTTPATVVIHGADAVTGEVVSPYEVKYTSAGSINTIPASSYAFSASNTLLTITLDSSILKANHVYTFEFAVRGTLDDTPVAFINRAITAKSDATITQVSDLWLDDFNFINTPTKDVTLVIQDTPLIGQGVHIGRAVALPNATYDGTTIPFARYLLPTFLSLAAFDPLPGNSVYLVSPAKLSGTVEVVSQTETYLDAALKKTETLTNLGSFYGLDYASSSGIVAGDLDLSNLTNIASDAKYLLAVPSNHGIDELGLKEVYADVLEDTADEIAGTTTVVTSGANISSGGIYYIYTIPIPTSRGGYISSATLDLNVSVNGVNITGQQAFAVQ